MKTMKRIRMYNVPFYRWLLLPVLCLMAGGCVFENHQEEGGQEDETPVPVTIRLFTRFGGQGKDASTRGLSETDEGQVDNAYIFFLRVSDNKVHSVVKGKNVTNTSITEKTFTASLEVAGSAGQEFRCMVLANAGSYLDGQNMNLYKEKGYEEIQQMLVSQGYTAAPVLAAGGFVMWGEAETHIVASRRPQSVTIHMVRAVARVDIGIGAGPDKWDGKDAEGNTIPFKIKKVFIFKPNNKYAFMPLAEAYDASTKRVTQPSPVGEVAAAPFTYDVQPGGTTSFTATIYLPEADIRQGADAASGDANHTNRCAIVVQGSYDGHADTYYRIDFHNGAILADLLRNHRYRASITSVSGDGETTPQEAYESRRVNISATVLPWNDWSQDVIFDGVDHVYVERKTILLPGNAGQTGKIAIESNVETTQWQMSLDGVNYSTDKTIANTDFEVTKPDAKEGGSLQIKTLTQLAEGAPEKTATLWVKIHRLNFSISITQKPDTPDEWVEGGDVPKEF